MTDTDWSKRRPRAEFWRTLKETVDILSGRTKAPYDDINTSNAPPS